MRDRGPRLPHVRGTAALTASTGESDRHAVTPAPHSLTHAMAAPCASCARLEDASKWPFNSAKRVACVLRYTAARSKPSPSADRRTTPANATRVSAAPTPMASMAGAKLCTAWAMWDSTALPPRALTEPSRASPTPMGMTAAQSAILSRGGGGFGSSELPAKKERGAAADHAPTWNPPRDIVRAWCPLSRLRGLAGGRGRVIAARMDASLRRPPPPPRRAIEQNEGRRRSGADTTTISPGPLSKQMGSSSSTGKSGPGPPAATTSPTAARERVACAPAGERRPAGPVAGAAGSEAFSAGVARLSLLSQSVQRAADHLRAASDGCPELRPELNSACATANRAQAASAVWAHQCKLALDRWPALSSHRAVRITAADAFFVPSSKPSLDMRAQATELQALLESSVAVRTGIRAAVAALEAASSALKLRRADCRGAAWRRALAPLAIALLALAAGVSVALCPPAAAAIAGVLPSVLGATAGGVAGAGGAIAAAAASIGAGTVGVASYYTYSSKELSELTAIAVRVDGLLDEVIQVEVGALRVRSTVEGSSAWAHKTDADKDRLAASVHSGTIALDKITQLWGPVAALDVARRVVSL